MDGRYKRQRISTSNTINQTQKNAPADALDVEEVAVGAVGALPLVVLPAARLAEVRDGGELHLQQPPRVVPPWGFGCGVGGALVGMLVMMIVWAKKQGTTKKHRMAETIV